MALSFTARAGTMRLGSWLFVRSFLCVALFSSRVVSQQPGIVNQPQAEQFPFRNAHREDVQPRKIAIIGAGAGGASAAYHLSRFANDSHYNVPLEITIFDVNDRAGGRTTTVNALNNPKYPVEVGASIFVKVNHILYNASRDFGLITDAVEEPSTGSFFDMGVWDGKDFVFKTESDADRNKGITGRIGGWWDIAKLLWKYGLSPIRTNQLMKSTVGKFLKLYDEQFPFDDLTEVTKIVGLDEFTGVTGEDALTRGGISEEFSRHAVQASTRVNYAQNLGNIHGLETMVCMATDGAMAVEGGNWQIFDQFVKRSGAKALYNTTVTAVEKTVKNKFRISSKSSSSSSSITKSEETEEKEEFDSLILAAPYQFANISFHPALTNKPARIDYVTLHVTLFTSPRLPSPRYFGLDGQWEVPDVILTTLPPDSKISGANRGKYAVGPTKFWSISTRALDPQEGDDASAEKQYLYKIFAPEPISVTFLGRMFNFDIDKDIAKEAGDQNENENGNLDDSGDSEFIPLSKAPPSLITWYHVKTWQSYPYLPPTTAFPPIQLDDDVYYTSSIEPFISTMETSALSGRNVARLIIDDLEWKAKETRNTDDTNISRQGSAIIGKF